MSKSGKEKEKQRSSDEVEEVNKPSFLGIKDRQVKPVSQPRVTSVGQALADANDDNEQDMEDKWQ